VLTHVSYLASAISSRLDSDTSAEPVEALILVLTLD